MVLLSGCLQMLICCRLLRLEFNQRGTIDKAIALAVRKLLFNSDSQCLGSKSYVSKLNIDIISMYFVDFFFQSDHYHIIGYNSTLWPSTVLQCIIWLIKCININNICITVCVNKWFIKENVYVKREGLCHWVNPCSSSQIFKNCWIFPSSKLFLFLVFLWRKSVAADIEACCKMSQVACHKGRSRWRGVFNIDLEENAY